MPSGRVVDANEIYLDGTFYPLKRPVQSILSSVYAAKVTIGDTTKDSDPTRSTIAWSDWRGGIGRDLLEGAVDTDRSWWSTMQQRFKGHLVLAPLAVQTAVVSGRSSSRRYTVSAPTMAA